MPEGKDNTKRWREFEVFVARLEKHLGPRGAAVTSPDRLVDIETGRLREVDASIRTKIGSADILITIECRKRKSTEDVTWIEQLASKRQKVGASKTIAVSSTGFSEQAKITAHRAGIELRILAEVTTSEIERWISPSSFTHLHRDIESVVTRVILEDGSFFNVDRDDERFAHAVVINWFNVDLFIQLLEARDPDSFWRIPLDGSLGEITLAIKGDSPNLIPNTKQGNAPLYFRVGNSDVPIALVLIQIFVRYKLGVATNEDGNHLLYSAPDSLDKPAASVSSFSLKVGDKDGRIDVYRDLHTRTEDAQFVTEDQSLKRYELKMLQPRLTDMQNVDTATLDRLPVVIKIRRKRPIKCILLHPPEHLFSEDYRRSLFVFIKEKDALAIMAAERDGKQPDITESTFNEVPRGDVQYIEITPAINYLAKTRSSPHLKRK